MKFFIIRQPVWLSKGLGLSAAGLIAAAGTAHANMVINASYDPNITSDPNGASIVSCLSQVCAYYNAHFSDNISVNVIFREDQSILGENSPRSPVNETYSAFRAALAADATTGDDATALTHLSAGPANPVDGEQYVTLARPNARALGFSTSSDLDDIILLGTDSCFFDHSSPIAGKYDLYAVACHEMDECLGTYMGLALTPTPDASDMFRYDENHHRTYDLSNTHHAYFSLDGINNIVEYNQFNRIDGDWGDWIQHASPQVQDHSATKGQSVDMGPSETTLLDAIGYNYIPNAVPEPASFAVFGLGAFAVYHRRNRRRVAWLAWCVTETHKRLRSGQANQDSADS